VTFVDDFTDHIEKSVALSGLLVTGPSMFLSKLGSQQTCLKRRSAAGPTYKIVVFCWSWWQFR